MDINRPVSTQKMGNFQPNKYGWLLDTTEALHYIEKAGRIYWQILASAPVSMLSSGNLLFNSFLDFFHQGLNPDNKKIYKTFHSNLHLQFARCRLQIFKFYFLYFGDNFLLFRSANPHHTFRLKYFYILHWASLLCVIHIRKYQTLFPTDF